MLEVHGWFRRGGQDSNYCFCEKSEPGCQEPLTLLSWLSRRVSTTTNSHVYNPFTVQYHVYILGQYRIILDRYNDP
jgi:hypothetical protein